MSIGKNLRQLRLNAGMTQEQAAGQLGITRQALSSYESERTRPDIDMLLRLCKIYNTDMDGILYGQDRVLRSLRIIKRISAVLFVLLAALTAVSSALLWSANYFFPIQTGQLSAEGKLLLASHIRLTHAWERMDGLILTLTTLGALLLLVLFAAWNCRVPLRAKLLYIASLAATLFVIAALFGAADPVFAPIDYLLTPMFASARLLILFAVHLGIEFLRGRQRKPE